MLHRSPLQLASTPSTLQHGCNGGLRLQSSHGPNGSTDQQLKTAPHVPVPAAQHCLTETGAAAAFRTTEPALEEHMQPMQQSCFLPLHCLSICYLRYLFAALEKFRLSLCSPSQPVPSRTATV